VELGARSQKLEGKRKEERRRNKEIARRSVFTNMRCSRILLRVEVIFL